MSLASHIQNYVREHPKIRGYLVKGMLIGTAFVAGVTSVTRFIGCKPEPTGKTTIEYAQQNIPSLANYFSGFGNLDEPTEVYIKEAKYVLTNANYASSALEDKVREHTKDNNISPNDVAKIQNIDGAPDGSNREEISKGTSIVDPYNKLPPSIDSLVVLNDELYARVAGNKDLVHAFTLQDFTSLFKELREAPYADELMKRINAEPKENVSQAWNYKVRRENEVLYTILKLTPENQEAWQFRFDNGSYHLRLWSDKNSIMDLSNHGIKEWFENKEDAEYAMMQLWVPETMTWYDVSQWKIQLKPDTWPNPNFDTLRNNMDVILGKKKINAKIGVYGNREEAVAKGGLSFKGLRDRIVNVSKDHSIKSYTFPSTDFEYATANWGRQTTGGHGGFNLVPESYGAIVVPVLEQNFRNFELIKLAYGLGVLDMDDVESSDTKINQMYPKALGYIAFEQLGRNPVDSGDHQYAALVVPKKILQQLPSGIIVYRGQSVSPYSIEDALIKDGVKYVREPNGSKIVWRLPTVASK